MENSQLQANVKRTSDAKRSRTNNKACVPPLPISQTAASIELPWSERGAPFSLELPKKYELLHLNEADLQKMSLLHDYDVSEVHTGLYNSREVVVESASPRWHPEIFYRLVNEVIVYEQLEALQGDGIPKFVFHGFLGLYTYYVGKSPHGVDAVKLSSIQKRRLIKTLERIHGEGVLLNYYDRETIYVDETGNPYLTVFQHATKLSSEAQRTEEMKRFRRTLESL